MEDRRSWRGALPWKGSVWKGERVRFSYLPPFIWNLEVKCYDSTEVSKTSGQGLTPCTSATLGNIVVFVKWVIMRKIERTCPECGTIFIGQAKTCSISCGQQGRRRQRIQKIEDWWNDPEAPSLPTNQLHKLRKYLIKKFEACWECGWNKRNPITNFIPLQLDHIDGDCSNNLKSNLKLICPNCHSLTPTYGSLNKGHSKRVKRSTYTVMER